MKLLVSIFSCLNTADHGKLRVKANNMEGPADQKLAIIKKIIYDELSNIRSQSLGNKQHTSHTI